MSERASGYARQPDNIYLTPAWVWDALYDVEPWARHAFDCAPHPRNGYDFLTDWTDRGQDIATNPPYGRDAVRFVRHALDLPDRPRVAMLLPAAWDYAAGRADLFAKCRAFETKYVLTRRISWDNLESVAAPSTHHAWFVWNPAHVGGAMLRWL